MTHQLPTYSISIIILVCFSYLLSAQQPTNFTVNAKLFTPKMGLSHRDITCVAEDERKIIWVGTENGLNRFDGKYFKVFSVDDGLKENRLDELYSDKEILWCLHDEVVLNQYTSFTLFHTMEEKSISFDAYFGNQSPFKESDIQEIDLENDALYIYLNNQKIYQYTTQNGFVELPFVKKNEEVLAQDEVGNFLIWNKDEEPSIRMITSNGGEVFKIGSEFLATASRLKYMGQSVKGDYWIGYKQSTGVEFVNITAKGEITFFDPYQVIEAKTELTKKRSYKIKSFAYLPQYDAFLYANRQYFLLITPKGKLLHLEKSEVLTGINGIELAQEHTFWLPCKKGFYQMELRNNPFTNYLKDQNLKDFRSITRYQDHLYFNSYSGVFKVDPNSKQLPKVIFESGLSSIVDQSGHLWISLYNFLVKYNLQTGDTTRFELPNNHEIWSLYEDKKGQIWYSRKGLSYLNPSTGTSKTVNYNAFTELADNTVYHFYEKEDGKILLCTTSGLYVLDIEKGITERYSAEGDGKFQIPATDIRHLYFDKNDKTYWLATGNQGLIHWNPNTKTSKVYQLYRLEANTIHAVYADDFDFLWLSTENGIIQFNKNSHRFKAYLPNQGTSSSEFNRVSHYQDTDGTIYFGSINGVTSFHPKDFVESNTVQESVNIVVIELNQFLNKTGQIENVTPQFYENQQITLQPNDRLFKLTLALDNYSHNEEAIYYYKLKNDETWQKANDNEISMSSLPYGNNTLQIKGLLTNGQFSKLLEIPVKARRPFYLTWWFGLLLLSFTIGTSIWFVRWRTRLLTIQKNVLEQEVQQRTAQIQKDKKTIEAQAEKLKVLDETKSRFFANVSHELRTPITLIQSPIDTVLKSQQLDNRNFTLLTKAARSTKNLLSLVNEILDLIKLDAAKLQLNEESVIIYSFFRRIVANFQSLADKKGIIFTFKYQLQQSLQVRLDVNKTEKILNNLLSNAFKFTPKHGKITLRVGETTDNNLLISVQDTGRGIPTNDIPHIFNRFYQSSPDNYRDKKAEGGLGIGLSLSMEFVKLMNGKMWVKSDIESKKSGSIFYLELPKEEVIAMLPTEDKLVINNEELIIDNDVAAEEYLPSLKSLVNKNENSNTKKQTILLVEDNLDLQEYISFLLSPYYNVVLVENGQEALGQLTIKQSNNQTIQLIISDVMMPIMDGFEFLETLKANEVWRTIPVIMLTARVELKDKLHALRIGVDDYLVKPFKEEELLVRIKNLLANYAIRQSVSSLVITADDAIEKDINEQPVISEKDQKWLVTFEKLVVDTLEDSRFSVNYLAELQNITRRTLSSKVKKLTGLTTNQYIRTVRLNLAKDLLESQSYPTVTEVAHRVGFQKVEYFSKLFRENFGKLPSEYL